MKKRALRLEGVYRLLEPGPVVLISTQRGEKANIMTQSWHTMMDFDPPLVGVVLSDRNYSFETLRETKECVINVPDASLAKAVAGCGNVSGRNMDKFKRFGLTPAPASMVRAPLIEECFACVECRVVDDCLAGRYDFFVLQAVKAWVSPRLGRPRTLHHRGRGVFMIAGREIRLASRMK